MIDHSSPSSPSIRLLIVDDHAAARKALAQLLRDEPDLAIVGEASDGKEALQQMARTAPDVVLLDVRMPVLDGIATSQIIRTEFPQVRVIGMSVGPDPDQTAAMQGAGATACIDKADLEAIVAAIRHCLNHRQAA
jgi:DNA-binding NarL/FixJ family response regulator